ncbi:MAG: ankyrin repeat domain-containing protein [Nitrospira sp.]|nr:ankyrin repeat domain-containing protein [Nitrospira sp.]
MHAAAASGDLMTVQMSLSNGANVNWKAPYNHTALMEAAAWGYVEIVEELLKHGALVNLVNDFRQTALDNVTENRTNMPEDKRARVITMLRQAGGKSAKELT